MVLEPFEQFHLVPVGVQLAAKRVIKSAAVETPRDSQGAQTHKDTSFFQLTAEACCPVLPKVT